MRVGHAVRQLIEKILPWYDPAETERRRQETERIRKRSIAARIALEDVPKRYERYDDVVRR